MTFVSCIYFIISPWLPVNLLPDRQVTLFGVLWIFMVATRVASLPLSLSEWVKTRYLYISAGIKHRLYGRNPSTSGLLLLPPEVRLQIWEELFPRTRCARGDTRITVICKEIVDDNGTYDPGPWDLGPPPRYRMRTTPRIPVEFLRTCRQIYEEGNHFLYVTSTFEFLDHRALYYFVDTRSLSQQRNIRYLVISWSALYFWSLKFSALRAFEMPSITEKLQDLRILEIEARVPDCRDESAAEYIARSTSQLLRRFRVSEAVIVKLYLFACTFRRPYQEEFARAGWALLREPETHVPAVAAHREQNKHATYVFVATTPIQ